MRKLVFMAAALLPGALAAQTEVVFPSDHTNRAGTTHSSYFPFSNGISRMMAVYENWDINIPVVNPPHQITRLGFRQDDQYPTSTGYGVELEILMGWTDKTAATVTNNFDNTYSTTAVLVLNRKPILLPNLNPQTPQDIHVDLDTPFPYAPPSTTPNLVVEYRVYSNANSNAHFPYYLDNADHISTSNVFGSGCAGSGGQIPNHTTSTAYLGGSWYLYIRTAPASSLVFVFIDFRKQLPPLLGDPFGAPGCSLLVSNFVSLGATTNSSGSANWTLSLPDEVLYHQATLFTQVLCNDYWANAFHWTASNGAETTFGVRPRMTIITHRGTTTSATGSVGRYDGTISLFTYQ